MSSESVTFSVLRRHPLLDQLALRMFHRWLPRFGMFGLIPARSMQAILIYAHDATAMDICAHIYTEARQKVAAAMDAILGGEPTVKTG